MKVYSPEENGRIVAHENVHFSITKRGAQSLRMKMRNAELNLKGASYLRLVAACSKIARKS